ESAPVLAMPSWIGAGGRGMGGGGGGRGLGGGGGAGRLGTGGVPASPRLQEALSRLPAVADTIAGTLVGPYLIKSGVDRGATDHALAVVWVAASAYLLFTLADLVIN